MMTDEQLLEAYSKEIYGKYYHPSNNLTVARLIDSHRTLREWYREWSEGNLDAQKKGYKCGYEMGIKNAADNTIHYEDLRKMTVQELANLIGEDT